MHSYVRNQVLSAWISKGLIRTEMKCKQRKTVTFCRLWENRDQQKPVILLIPITHAVKMIYLSTHQITAHPNISILTDVTKIQVFICAAPLSLSCDCLRRMRNNMDDHGRQKTSQKSEKKAIRKQNQAQDYIRLPCFSHKIIFTFATKMEGGVYSSYCIFQKQLLWLTEMNSVHCFQQRMYYFTFISMSRKPELLLQ